ncbi:MAG: HIT family protein [Bacteroidia bacterium]|nr:HIT family protein [Bacteroidia bacterium]
MTDCPFCSLNRELIAENSLAVAFYDAYPVNPGHALVIPRRHVADYFDLTPAERHACWDLLDEVKQIVDAKFSPDGYNAGVNAGTAAGQTVFHVHLHLIPRYVGDVEDATGGVRNVVDGMGKW